MERKHIADRTGPRASTILSYRIVESLKFMISDILGFSMGTHGDPWDPMAGLSRPGSLGLAL